MKISVNFNIANATPMREFDFIACLDGEEESGVYGYGRTAREAVSDLFDVIEIREEEETEERRNNGQFGLGA